MATSESDFLTFVGRSTAARVAAAQAQLERARNDRCPDAVHDLRVAFRRMLSVLTCFERTLGRARTKRLRKAARTVLAAGGAVRDRDIALNLALEAGLDPDAELCRALKRQRAHCQKELGSLAAELEPRDLAGLWNDIEDGIRRNRSSLGDAEGRAENGPGGNSPR